LEGQRQIATAEMERDQAVALIKAKALSQQLATHVQARNAAAVQEAQASAQAVKIVAQGIFFLLFPFPSSSSFSFLLVVLYFFFFK
jgi:hypothetical protein